MNCQEAEYFISDQIIRIDRVGPQLLNLLVIP